MTAKERRQYYQTTVRFSMAQRREIERYAERYGISVADAVRDLCDRALAKGFDEQYAPRINEVTKRVGDATVSRVEIAILHAVDELVAEFRVSEIRKIVALSEGPLDDDGDPNLNTSASSVFLPERYEDEREFVWPS